eukprot:TRINITY_DN1063_c1_g2_i1.p1 TRINITY_DN1063_c1_g2~~TRINITY_DN1063_c1_g2_i1.p1  ORF type:complete len:357 (-),score=130.93 TRINITY_DN1063_c1_g2_i1:436-1506(-)
MSTLRRKRKVKERKYVIKIESTMEVIQNEIYNKSEMEENRVLIGFDGFFYDEYKNVDSLRRALAIEGLYVKILMIKGHYVLDISWGELKDSRNRGFIDLPYFKKVEDCVYPSLIDWNDIVFFKLVKSENEYYLVHVFVSMHDHQYKKVYRDDRKRIGDDEDETEEGDLDERFKKNYKESLIPPVPKSPRKKRTTKKKYKSITFDISSTIVQPDIPKKLVKEEESTNDKKSKEEEEVIPKVTKLDVSSITPKTRKSTKRKTPRNTSSKKSTPRKRTDTSPRREESATIDEEISKVRNNKEKRRSKKVKKRKEPIVVENRSDNDTSDQSDHKSHKKNRKEKLFQDLPQNKNYRSQSWE